MICCVHQVSCKIINVRSGAELPEKCRELALHFENQGTPIMIGKWIKYIDMVSPRYFLQNVSALYVNIDHVKMQRLSSRCPIMLYSVLQKGEI